MNKETFSRYGWIIIIVLILAVMITFAAPFGYAIVSGVNNFVNGFGNAMNGNAGGGGSGSSGIKLDAPTNLTLTNNQLSFDSVPNANQYILYVNDEVSATYATSPIDVSTYIETYGTPITFKLVASDSTGTYGDSAATEYIAAGDGKMILKAGTYRFNDTPSIPNNFEQSIVFTITDGTQIVECNAMSVVDNTIADRGDGITYNTKCLKYSMYIADYNSYFSIGVYNECESFKEWSTSLMAEDILRNTTLAKDTEVDDTFGSWFISNTNYNEVNGATDEESVLGMRRFKETIMSIPLSEEFSSAEECYNANFIEIESVFAGGNTLYGFTPYFSVDGDSICVFKLTLGEEIQDSGFMYIRGSGNLGGVEVAVIATANATVDEWLLANTEPVEASEEETYVIEAGTYRFNDVLDFSNVPQNIIHLGYSYNDYYYAILNANNFETDAGTYNGVFFGVGDTTVLEPLWGSGTVDALNYDGWIFDEQIIQTIPEDTEVSAEFYEWFTANTKRVIEVDELPTEDIDTGAIYKVNELVEDTDTNTIAGTWVINETTSYTGEFEYNVDFYVVNGTTTKNYIGLFAEDNSGTPRLSYRSSSTTTNMVHYFNSGNWAANYYKTITITGGDDIANEDFATWLQSNTTKYKMVDKYYQYVDDAWVER